MFTPFQKASFLSVVPIIKNPVVAGLVWVVELGGGVTRLSLRDFAREPGLGAKQPQNKPTKWLALFFIRPAVRKQAFTAVLKKKPLSRFVFRLWSWAGSNRRPNKKPKCFLHAYPVIDCREQAGSRQPV